jgi:hypothetical protein
MVKRFFNPSSSDFAINSMKEILGSDNLSNPVEKYRKARKCMLDAISAKGDLTLMYSHCVQLSLAMMEFEDALRYATIVAALLPQDAAAQGQLDMVKERMGVSR